MTANKDLHILIMPSWYKSVDTPVLGTFFEEQARGFQKCGSRVGIIYPEYTPPAKFLAKNIERFNDFYMDNGMPTYHIRKHKGVPKFRKYSYNQFSKEVNRVFEEYCEVFGIPDIIHAHSVFHAGIAASFISRIHNIPLVITEHLTAYIMGYIKNQTDNNIARDIFASADRSLIVSNDFRDRLENYLGIKERVFHVIHNLVPDIFFEDFTTKSHSKGEKFIFFTNSFLLPRKNINLIINALKILRDRGHEAHLRIGGSGPLEKEIRKMIIQNGLQEHAEMLGNLWRHEVKREVSNCHAFVLASQYETFGVVIIESLACGRPVICTDSGGPRDILTEEHGVIVNESTADKLADGMEKLIKTYSAFDQRKLSEYCHSRFNESHIINEIYKVYDEVISERKISSFS